MPFLSNQTSQMIVIHRTGLRNRHDQLILMLSVVGQRARTRRTPKPMDHFSARYSQCAVGGNLELVSNVSRADECERFGELNMRRARRLEQVHIAVLQRVVSDLNGGQKSRYRFFEEVLQVEFLAECREETTVATENAHLECWMSAVVLVRRKIMTEHVEDLHALKLRELLR